MNDNPMYVNGQVEVAQRSDGGETRSMEEIVIDRVKETDSEFRREKKGYGQEMNPGDGRRFESSQRKYMSRSVQKSEERVGTYTVKVPEGRRKGKK